MQSSSVSVVHGLDPELEPMKTEVSGARVPEQKVRSPNFDK